VKRFLATTAVLTLLLTGCGHASDADWDRRNDRRADSEFMTVQIVPQNPPCLGYTLKLVNSNDEDHAWWANSNDDDFAHGTLTKAAPTKDVNVPRSTDPAVTELHITVRQKQDQSKGRVYFDQNKPNPAACPEPSPSKRK
jgi:hypothetical protein